MLGYQLFAYILAVPMPVVLLLRHFVLRVTKKVDEREMFLVGDKLSTSLHFFYSFETVF